jgi:Rrf2 family protein
MIFNATATHALRALSHLAASEQEAATLGRDLAADIAVPAHYLAKVLATLARAGLLVASRGVRGGYRLARRPEEIALVEIVEPFEGKRVRPGCLLQPDHPCRDDVACSAHGAWSEVKTTYLRFLETTTLADIRGDGVKGGKRAAAKRGARSGRRSSGGARSRRERA